jgi:hypothetical protein
MKLSLGTCVQYQIEIERVLFRLYFQAAGVFEGPAEGIANGHAQKKNPPQKVVPPPPPPPPNLKN